MSGGAGPSNFRALGIPLRFEDGLHCPGLSPAPDAADATVVVRGDVDDGWRPDVAVVTREVFSAHGLAFRVEHAPGTGYRLTMPAAGTYRIDEAGSTIRCAAEQGDAPNGVGLLTQGIPIAATLRGFEPFHAAGVAVDGRGVLIGGPVGAGKSSLALHLVLAGADLLADDVVAVTRDAVGPVLHAGARLLRVREPERARLGADLGPLRVVAGLDSRQQLQAPPPPVASPPLDAVYLIERDAEPGPPVLDTAPSGIALLALTYNLSVHSPTRRLRQLEVCTAIAEQARVRRAVVRPGVTATDLAAAIVDDVRSSR